LRSSTWKPKVDKEWLSRTNLNELSCMSSGPSTAAFQRQTFKEAGRLNSPTKKSMLDSIECARFYEMSLERILQNRVLRSPSYCFARFSSSSRYSWSLFLSV